MPPRDLATLDLQPRHLQALLALLQTYVPEAQVWAYGSRVVGGAHEGSDLDIVLRHPADLTQEVAGGLDLQEALQNSALPMVVETRQWARLPVAFHHVIEAGYIELQAGRKTS